MESGKIKKEFKEEVLQPEDVDTAQTQFMEEKKEEVTQPEDIDIAQTQFMEENKEVVPQPENVDTVAAAVSETQAFLELEKNVAFTFARIFSVFDELAEFDKLPILKLIFLSSNYDVIHFALSEFVDKQMKDLYKALHTTIWPQNKFTYALENNSGWQSINSEKFDLLKTFYNLFFTAFTEIVKMKNREKLAILLVFLKRELSTFQLMLNNCKDSQKKSPKRAKGKATIDKNPKNGKDEEDDREDNIPSGSKKAKLQN